jgi:hypothetical protein
LLAIAKPLAQFMANLPEYTKQTNRLSDASQKARKAFELAKAKGGLDLQVRTVDFAFVLRQLADLDVQGDIAIKANSDGVLLDFDTSANKYTCLIPACTVKGVRHAALMQQYTPTQTLLEVKQSVDPDDEYTDDATAEKQDAELLRKYKKAGWV